MTETIHSRAIHYSLDSSKMRRNRDQFHLMQFIGLIIISIISVHLTFDHCQAGNVQQTGDFQAIDLLSLPKSSNVADLQPRLFAEPGAAQQASNVLSYGFGFSPPLVQASGMFANADWQEHARQDIFDAKISHAVETGCRRFADAILAAHSSPQQRFANLRDPKTLDLMDLIEQERMKKASPKHTPRFG